MGLGIESTLAQMPHIQNKFLSGNSYISYKCKLGKKIWTNPIGWKSQQKGKNFIYKYLSTIWKLHRQVLLTNNCVCPLRIATRPISQPKLHTCSILVGSSKRYMIQLCQRLVQYGYKSKAKVKKLSVRVVKKKINHILSSLKFAIQELKFPYKPYSIF